jgi:hypothetical protein
MQYILFRCASHPFDNKYENIVFSTKDRCLQQQCRCTQQEEYKASKDRQSTMPLSQRLTLFESWYHLKTLTTSLWNSSRPLLHPTNMILHWTVKEDLIASRWDSVQKKNSEQHSISALTYSH